MTLQDQFDDLEERANKNGQVIPLVHTKWGYAALYAYIFKIKSGNGPSQYWVCELDKDKQVISIKRICNY